MREILKSASYAALLLLGLAVSAVTLIVFPAATVLVLTLAYLTFLIHMCRT